MKPFLRLLGIWLLLGCVPLAWSQSAASKVDRVDVQYIGPASVSEQFIHANIRLKAGDTYTPSLADDDVHSLYGTGQFNDIHVLATNDNGSLIVGSLEGGKGKPQTMT